MKKNFASKSWLVADIMICTSRFIILLVVLCISSISQAQESRFERAQSIADSFFRYRFGVMDNSKHKSRALFDSHLLQSSVATDEPTFFFFMAPADRGFVIVSGDDVAMPLIGFSEEPMPASTDDIPDAMMEYLMDIDNQIRKTRTVSCSMKAGESRASAELSQVGNVVVNLGTARWSQRAPFNRLCFTSTGRQAATGCIATAFAIVMRHHKWPEKGAGTVYNPITGEKLPLGHTYNWDNMPLEYTDYTEEQANEVAVVMRDLGYAYGLSYGTGSTSGSENSYRMTKHFGYVDLVAQSGMASGAMPRFVVGDAQWDVLLRKSLDESCPVPYVATNAGTGNDAKHIFIVDGYTDAGYYHFNWGWGGSCNGYFTLARLDPTASDDYASKVDSHKAFFGLKPLKKNQYTVAVSATKGGKATVNGGDSVMVDEGTEVTLLAVPDEGYRFACWTAAEDTIGCESELKVVVTASATYKAVFDEIEDTGIDNIHLSSEDKVIYNLSGIRLKRIEQKGVYIVNGKKVLVE